MYESGARSSRPRVSATTRIVIAMALGVLVGGALGSRVDGIGVLGKAIVDLIKALAAPLLIFAVLGEFHARISTQDAAC